MEIGIREAFQVISIGIALAGGYFTMKSQLNRVIDDIIKLSKCMAAAESRLDLSESHTAVFSQQLIVLSEINSPANLERRAVQAAATEAHIEALTSRVADLLRQHNGTHKSVKNS